MQLRNVPALDGRYWAAILAASVLGTTFGDFVSNDLGLGFAGALLPLVAVFTVIFVAERKAERGTEAYYWAAIVVTRAAATNLGDALARTLHLGYGGVSAAVVVMLVAFLLVSRRVASVSSAPNPDAGIMAKVLPTTDARYWTAILIASTLGTTLGDFVAEGLGLGLGAGSLVLCLLLALVLALEFIAKSGSEARYWLIIAVVRTTGTVMGDFLTGEEGLDLGFAIGAGLVCALLVAILALPNAWKAAERRWPVLGAVWGMARNDLAVWMRSPAAIAAALLPALGMGLLVAMLTNSVGRQPTALVVESGDRFATRMGRLIAGDRDAYQIEAMTAAEAESAFGDQRVAAVIVVPADFDAGVVRGKAEVHLYLNNVNIDISDDLRRSVTRSVAEFDAPQLGLLGELHGPSKGLLLPNPYRVAVAEHDLRETDVSFLQYQVIPIILLVVISIGLLGTALLTARDFERATAKVIMLSPAGRLPLVLGRLLGGTLITVALVAPLVILGFVTHYIPYCHEESGAPMWLALVLSGPCGWVLPVPSWTHGLALGALLAAVTLTTVGLGTLLGIALRDTRLVTMTGLNAAVYLFFLGGGFTTIAFLPDWIQSVSRFIPTSYAVNGLRQALFYPDLIGVARDLAVLSGCAALSATLASLMLARAWRRT